MGGIYTEWIRGRRGAAEEKRGGEGKREGRGGEGTKFGSQDAVVPEVEGSACITGRHEFLIDPDDSLAKGFVLR